jgi:hypothetical protein
MKQRKTCAVLVNETFPAFEPDQMLHSSSPRAFPAKAIRNV